MALSVLLYKHSSVKLLFDNYMESLLTPAAAGGAHDFDPSLLLTLLGEKSKEIKRQKGNAPLIGSKQKKTKQRQLVECSIDGEKKLRK